MATAKVIAKNVIELRPGGFYNLNEDNEIERRVVNLHLLSMFAELAANELCENGECMQTVLGMRLEQLGDDLFDKYMPFIANGIDIFSYQDFQTKEGLAKYSKRTFVRGFMNASPEETHKGLPEGWWYEFPGQAQKMFDFGFIAIDHDECIRICLYNDSEIDNPIDMYLISRRGDYSQIFAHFPTYAIELVQVCEFIYNEYHI